MRVFIGIALSDDAKRMISENEDILRKRILSGNFVPEENHHITLHFLGDIEEERIAQLKEAMDEASLHLRPFNLETSWVGEFRKRKRFIIWMGLEESEELQKAHGRLKDALEDKGFETEKAPFVPHITLVRNAIWRKEDSGLTFRETESTGRKIPIMADRFVLFESKRVDGKLSYINKYESNLYTEKSINNVYL